MRYSPYLDLNRDLATLRRIVMDHELGKTARYARMAFTGGERTVARRLGAPASYLLKAS